MNKRSKKALNIITTRLPLLISALVACILLATPIKAEDIIVPHRGEVFTAPAAVMPSSCRGFMAPFTCYSDPEFELALEQEYWDIIGNGHFDRLKN